MSTHGDGGKGSGRRKEDASKVRDNWDLIFGKKQTMNEHEDPQNLFEDNERSENDETNNDYDDDGGRICPICRGDMVVTATGMYLFCDTCGHREELIDDDYL